MTAPGARKVPNAAVRTGVMLAAAAIVCAASLGVMQLVTHPVPTRPGFEDGDADRPHQPEWGPGTLDFLEQLALAGAIAFGGRKILKIRL